MTVAAIKPSVEYAGTPFGTTGPFPIADAGRAIPFLNPDHIVVTRITVTGEVVRLIRNVDYVINDNAVTFTSNESGLLPNERLLIERVTPIESTLDLVNGQAVSSAAIEDSVDYLTFLAQEINDRIGRAVPPLAAGTVTILPSASDPATLSLDQDQDGVYRLALSIPRGLQGVAGPAPNLVAGVVTTLDVGANPTLAFRTTAPGTIALDLGLPRGAPPILTPGVVQTLPSNQLATFGVRATGPASYALDIGIPAGQTGAAAAIEVGTVTTLASGQAATASVTPVSLSLYRLNLGLPRGDTGPAPTISVGNVTTLSTGQSATAAVRELAPGSFALDLGLPRGMAGQGINVRGAVATAAALPAPATEQEGAAYVVSDTATLYVLIQGVWQAAGSILATTLADALNARLDGVDANVVTLDGRLDTAESTITSLDARVDSLEAAGVDQAAVQEIARDAIAAALVSDGTITWSANDAANTISGVVGSLPYTRLTNAPSLGTSAAANTGSGTNDVPTIAIADARYASSGGVTALTGRVDVLETTTLAAAGNVTALTGRVDALEGSPTLDAAAVSEIARDAIGAAAVAGQYMVITPSDSGETITFAVSQTGLDGRYAQGSALTTVGDRVTALENATPSVDPTLGALAALNTQADRLAYFTGVDTAALATLTSTARNLLAQPSEADMRTLLQLGSAATISAPASGVNASPTQVVRGDDTRVLAGGAGGVNRMLNWDFSDGLTGWSIPSSGGNTTGLTLQSGLNYVDGATTYGRGDKQVAYARIVGSPAAGTFWDIFSAPVVVAPGERLSYSAEVAYYRCAVPRVRLFGYDAAGVSQGELAGVNGGANSATAGVDGEGMTRVAGFVDLPSNTVLRTVRILIQTEGTGAANPLLLATRAAVQAVSAGTSVHPPQAPGIVAAGGGGLLDTTGYNAGRVQESKAPVYIPAWITPAKVGAIGNGVADDTAAFQTMLNDGRPVCLTRPSVAWRLSSLTVPANRQVFSDGIRPTIQHFGANALWRVQGSNVRVGDFRVECTAANKAATNAPIFAIDVSAINIERVDLQNVIGFWTGGVLHDIGTVGQYDEVRLERVLTYLQRGVGIRLLRSFAGFWTDYVFMEWLRGQPGTANGGLYLDETVADINHPMIQIGSNQTAGAGGQLFQRTYCQGTNRQDCPNNHGYLLTGPAGGVRLQWCDVDGSGGNAFDATFFDEIELYDVRFTSIWGHNIRLDECGNVRGTARLTGRSGNPDGSNANRHGVYLVRDCARVDLQATITGTTGTPRRVEGRDLYNDLVSIPNRTRRGHERVQIDVDDGSQIGGGDLLEPAITYLTAPFGVSASGTPDTQITGPLWASAGTGGVASVGRVGFVAPQILAVNTYTRSVLRFNQTTAASVNPYLQIRLQPLELLSEQWVTIDFWARCETAPTTLPVRLWKVYGTGGSANESVEDEDVLIDATWRQFSRSFRAPSSFGKTIGAGSYGFVGIYLPVSVTRTVDFALLRVRWGSDLTPLQVPVNGLTFS